MQHRIDRDYISARNILESGSASERAKLAGRADTPPEMLYHMAADADATVRWNVAHNAAAPLEAAKILAQDDDADIRSVVGVKIANLLPDLPSDSLNQLIGMALEILRVLAQDRMPTVRAVIAERLAHMDSVPQDIVQTLARDADAMVAAPILEFSSLLTEDDLIEIVTLGISSESLAAVARRERISDRVSRAIVESEDDLAVPALLSNRTAEIGLETMEAVVAAGEGHPAWHQALVRYDGLPNELVVRVAHYASKGMVEELLARNPGLAPETADEIRNAVWERMHDVQVAWSRSDPEVRRAEIFQRDGRLDVRTMVMAANRGEETFVTHALGLLTGIETQRIRKALQGWDGNEVAVTLVWRADLGMSFAVVMQREMMGLKKPQILDGTSSDTSYALNEQAMRQILRVLYR